MTAKARTATAIRFTPGVYDRLSSEAAARSVSINWLVDRLCAEGMERMIPLCDWGRLTRRPADEVDQAEVTE